MRRDSVVVAIKHDMAEGGGFFLDLPDAEPTTTQLHDKVLSQTLESSHKVGKSPRSLGRHVDHQGSQMPMQRGCSQCVSLSYSEDLYRAFGVYVCGACRKDVKLISKVRDSICTCIVWEGCMTIFHVMDHRPVPSSNILLRMGT